jgi:hypothetical protein
VRHALLAVPRRLSSDSSSPAVSPSRRRAASAPSRQLVDRHGSSCAAIVGNCRRDRGDAASLVTARRAQLRPHVEQLANEPVAARPDLRRRAEGRCGLRGALLGACLLASSRCSCQSNSDRASKLRPCLGAATAGAAS